MIHFYYGPNVYESWQTVLEVCQDYEKDNWEVKFIDGQEVSKISDIFQDNESYNLFGTKSVIVIKRFFKNKSLTLGEKFLAYLQNHKNLELILWEDSNVDKRKALYKQLIKQKPKTKDFALLKSHTLRSWLKKEVRQRKINISEKVIRSILTVAGNEQNTIVTELDKIELFIKSQKGKVNEKELIDTISESKLFDIWDFMATVEKSKRVKRQKILNKLLEQGEQPFAILGMLSRHISTLIQVKDLMSRSVPQADIQKELGMHPFVITKAYRLASNFSMNALKRYHKKLLDIDLSIKEGRIEPELALTMFVGILS